MTNESASADHLLSTAASLTALDLALMPDHIRRFTLRRAKVPMPSQAEIDLAWQEWHRDFSGSQVYFVQRGHDPDGPIKIGSSKNPRKRIQQLQTSSAEPLVLLARCDGSGALEREYHKRFSSDRLNGEWFRPSTAITQEVDRLRRSHGAVAKFNPLASGEGASHG